MTIDSSNAVNPRYMLGLSDEPKQTLQPITGYIYEPILPLEEACEPLQSIVPRLQANIWVAKQNSKNPADGLTEDESAAIRLYTMEWDTHPDEPRGSLYAHLNRTLKSVDRGKLRPWFRYLKLLLTALAKLPPRSSSDRVARCPQRSERRLLARIGNDMVGVFVVHYFVERPGIRSVSGQCGNKNAVLH